MTKNDPISSLMQRAEEIAREKASLSIEEMRQMICDLREHQSDLEMQNEELRRAQAELNSVQARYFDIYNMAPVGYCRLNKQGVIMEANLTAATLLGMERHVLVQQPITRFILPEDQDIYCRHLKQLFGASKPQTCELRMVKMDGTAFWGHLAATAAMNADGTPVCRVVMSDITERKRAEQSLRESEQRHRVILQTAMDGFWLADTQGRLLEVNKTYCRMSGYSEQELLTMRIPDLEADERDNDTAAHIRKIIAQGEDRFESRHRRKDGSVFDVEVSVQYRHVEDGQMVAFLRDITERKMAEEALRESMTVVKQVLDTVPQGIFWKDKSSVYQGCNEVFARAVGLADSQQIVGKTDFDLPWSREDAEAYRADDALVISSGTPKRHIVEPLRQSDGTRLWIDTSKMPLLDFQRQVRGVLGVYEDITERKRAEELMSQMEARFRSVIRGHETILLVEDETKLRQVVAKSLRGQGYHVMVADNGQIAMKLWQENSQQIDLLVSDMRMPEGMSGLDLAEKFKKEKPSLKVIISSCYNLELAGQGSPTAGGIVYFQKTYEFEVLSQTIRDCLDSSR